MLKATKFEPNRNSKIKIAVIVYGRNECVNWMSDTKKGLESTQDCYEDSSKKKMEMYLKFEY